MAELSDPQVRALFEKPYYAVVSTLNDDGSILGAVAWVDLIDGQVAVNSAIGRQWPTNLERDPHITVVVYNQDNPFEYVEVRGTATGTTDGAWEHIDRLSQKYVGSDYPRNEGEERITYVVAADRVRHRAGG